MSFLKKFGQVVANITGIVSGIGPIFKTSVAAAVGIVTTVTDDLLQIASVIQTVEAIGQAVTPNIPGAQKLQMAAPLVAQAILRSAALAGQKVADQALYQQGSQKIADGMADVLNSLHDSGVQVTQPQDAKS